MRRVPMRAVALASLLALNPMLFAPGHKANDSNASFPPQSSAAGPAWVGPGALGAFVRRVIDGRVVCLEAGVEQARSIRGRDPDLILAPDSGQPQPQQTGFRIILRGTSELRSFPMATEAFKRAAAQWEALLRTDVAIVIDVDFGATLFGKEFDDDVVCATDAQVLGGNSLYSAVRAGLISEGYSPEKVSLYNSLPTKATPTDIGDFSGLTAPSATLRALGLLDQIADPDGELNILGPPPAIGLNSKFSFDFDPRDGIDPDKLDFESIVLHEIGHALGFISFVGQQEKDSSIDVEPSIWDLFRLRPDAIKSDFTAAERILSSGGEQSFYAGGRTLALSTGRPDGTGGDGKQASHWKDDNLTGRYIGVMDPTLGPGEHHFITDNDVSVLDALGYRAKSVIDPTVVVPLMSGRPQTGAVVEPPVNLGALSHTQYSIAIPHDCTQLRVDLNGNQDVDLFVRFGRTVVIQGHFPTADYISITETGSETITVSSSTSPALRQGVYYIGVANFGPGEASFTLTATVTGGNNSRAPAIFDIRAHLEGDALRLDCSAIDRDGDFAMAGVTILDETGRGVSLSSFAINSGNSNQLETQLAVSGLGVIPTALRASVILTDRSGKRSPEAIVDFSRAQAGGLAVTSASFSRSRLTLNILGLASDVELEINGQVVAPPQRVKVNRPGSKLTIKGNADELALRPGANRIRVKNASGWSNILILRI